MMGLDVNGNDNTPEWGWCHTEGCKEEAFPIWKRGDYPDDPDLLLCPKHIGELIGRLESERENAKLRANRDWWQRHAHDTLAELHETQAALAELHETQAALAELRKANAEVAHLNASYLAALDAAYHALLSYAHGNTAPALAEEVAEKVLRAIEKASK